MKKLSYHSDLFELITSSLLRDVVQIRLISKLGWLNGLVKHAIWTDSLCVFLQCYFHLSYIVAMARGRDL
jgi:hypothetical protein